MKLLTIIISIALAYMISFFLATGVLMVLGGWVGHVWGVEQLKTAGFWMFSPFYFVLLLVNNTVKRSTSEF